MSLLGSIFGSGGSSSSAAQSTDQSQNQRQSNFAGGTGSGAELSATGDLTYTDESTGVSSQALTGILDDAFHTISDATDSSGYSDTGSSGGAQTAGGILDDLTGGFSTNTLLIIGVAIVAVYFLTRGGKSSPLNLL